jgi:hypothetical protein
MEGLRTSQQAALLSATDPRALTLVYRFLLAKSSRPPFSSPQAPRPPPRLRSPAPGNRARHCTARRRQRRSRRRRWPPLLCKAAPSHSYCPPGRERGCTRRQPSSGARAGASSAARRHTAGFSSPATHTKLVPRGTRRTCTTRRVSGVSHSLVLIRIFSHSSLTTPRFTVIRHAFTQ